MPMMKRTERERQQQRRVRCKHKGGSARRRKLHLLRDPIFSTNKFGREINEIKVISLDLLNLGASNKHIRIAPKLGESACSPALTRKRHALIPQLANGKILCRFYRVPCGLYFVFRDGLPHGTWKGSGLDVMVLKL